MFDASTLRLMESARPLDGLDLEELPRLLTEAYAQVIAARLRMADEATLGTGWPQMSRMLGRVAATYEVVTLALPADHPQRQATAFVAASAHHARSRAHRVLFEATRAPDITRSAISPRVSAALLYSIGGHQSDAAEVGQDLLVAQPVTPWDQVQDAVGRLAMASGDGLLSLAEMGAPPLPAVGTMDERAVHRLLSRMLKGISATASAVLGMVDEDPNAHFERVLAATQDGPVDGALCTPTWLGIDAPGVRHLVLLLLAASRSMQSAAVVSLACPDGVDSDAWLAFLRAYASRRPLLWRNHREALSSGLLDAGHSAVMSFPTGAGKSALAELRAAAECLRGGKVLYLAPTKALVAQVRRQLRDVLGPLGDVKVRSYLGDDTPEVAGFDVAVMTPEACLVLATTAPESIEATGLIIFDECHLLSGPPSGSEKLPHRRAVDANLALLAVLRTCPACDAILLSAMVSNAGVLADWIAEVTGRPCTPYNDAWKPTRQIRGVLAYKKSELDALSDAVSQARAAEQSKAATERQMMAVPWGVFCHKQAWDPTTSYKALPMLAEAVSLKLNARWRLTANRNNVAGKLAAAFVEAGIRPLVFVQDINGTASAARALAERLEAGRHPAANLDAGLLNLAALELGDPDGVFNLVGGLVGRHHALLLPTERDAVEEAFRDQKELVAMVATPTLAQGMNLPAQVVIIAGDNRWEDDDDGGHAETLPVHEILNAAGRAGRAGMYAQGLVLLIPGMNVFSIHFEDNTIHFNGLEHASSLLGSPDQCLEVTDPLRRVMDLAAVGGELPEVVEYTLRRFQYVGVEDREHGEELLRSTLGYHQERSAGRQEQVEALVQTTLDRAGALDGGAIPTRFDDLARSIGVAPECLTTLVEALPDPAAAASFTISQWVHWLIAHFQGNPTQLQVLLHFPASGLLRIFMRTDNEEWESRCKRVADGLAEVLPVWIAGRPLSEIEPKLFEYSGRRRAVADLGLSRRFHNETAPALGGAGYLIRRVVELRADAEGGEPPRSLALDALPGCLARGVDSPEKLALHQVLAAKGATTRVAVHQAFAGLEATGADTGPFASMTEARRVMSSLVAGAR